MHYHHGITPWSHGTQTSKHLLCSFRCKIGRVRLSLGAITTSDQQLNIVSFILTHFKCHMFKVGDFRILRSGDYRLNTTSKRIVGVRLLVSRCVTGILGRCTFQRNLCRLFVLNLGISKIP